MAKQKKNMKKINRQNELKSKKEKSNLFPILMIIGAVVIISGIVGIAAYLYAQ